MQGVVQSAPQGVDAMAFAGTRSAAARETARVVDDYDYGMDDDEGYGVTAYDSDEEADYSKMDRGASAKRTQLTRFDFDTEEEFAAYKDSQEAAPKYGAAAARSLGGARFVLSHSMESIEAMHAQGGVPVRHQDRRWPEDPARHVGEAKAGPGPTKD